MSKKDQIYYMTDYYYGNRYKDDASAMEEAIYIENFFSLIRDNKKEDLEKELQKNPRALYYTNNLRQTALHIACKHNKPEILSLLLSKIPPQTNVLKEDRFINKRDTEGFSALMVCADNNNVECAKLLMSHQPDLKIVGYDLKRNVAHLAAQRNADEILRMVLEAKDKNGKNILDINVPCKERLITGFTPAHFAASNFAHKSIKVLKEMGANLNALAQQKTPMMIALQNGSRAVAAYLLEQPEVDLTIKDKQGFTAYDYALHFRTPIEDVQKIKEKLLEQKKSQTKKVSHKARTISIDSEHTKA
jgi:ankyrin repeat protein